MLDALPDRPLTDSEFSKLKDDNPGIHLAIGTGRPGDDVSGLYVPASDADQLHLVLWSPRDETWVHHTSVPVDAESKVKSGSIDEFTTEHWPDDHVLNNPKSFDEE